MTHFGEEFKLLICITHFDDGVKFVTYFNTYKEKAYF